MAKKSLIIKTVLLFLALTVTSGSVAGANSPELMVYSGIIPQGVYQGDGFYDITFSLYESQQGGTALWTETQSVYVYHGTFAVYLGAAERLNLSFDIPYWVGVKAGGKEEIWPLTGAVYTTEDSGTAVTKDAAAGPQPMVAADEVLSANIKEADNTTGQNTNAGSGVKTGHIQNFAVTNAKLGNGAVGTAKIKGGAVTSAKIADGTIATVDVANGAVTDAKITGPIGTAKLNVGTTAGTVAAGNHAHGFGQITGALGSSQLSGAYTGSVSFSNISSLTSGNITVTGNLTMPATTGTTGMIKQGADRLIHTYGTNNFFAGRSAGNLTMTGQYNTAIGYTALNYNTKGEYNTAIGESTLYFNTEGYRNTATGGSALYHNTTGYENTATGFRALGSNHEGYYNTAMGSDALYKNTKGYDNTALGAYALPNNSEGYRNTATGVYALHDNSTGTWNTAMGYWALSFGTANLGNTAIGAHALNENILGDYNTAIGLYALKNNEKGSYNTAVGYNADVIPHTLYTVDNATALGYGAIATMSNSVRIGNTSVTHIGGQVGFSNDSDVREKKDITDIPYGLNFIKALRPVEFRMINGNDRIDFGFIAQDIESLLGVDYNILGIGGTAERKLSLRYTDFIAPMVKAVQEQQEIIEQQQAELKSLKARMAAIEAVLAQMR